MKKTVITTLLVLLFLPLVAQNTVPPQITISTEKVNIGGNIYLVHKVESGETIYSLCRAYKVESEELFKANPQLKEGLKAGKIIYIPTSAKAEISQPNAPIQSAEDEQKEIEKKPESVEQEVPEKDYVEHRVKLFETLNSISRKYNVSVREIMEFNELESSFISFRQILRIPIKKESEKPEEELEDEEKVVEEIVNDIPEGIPFEQMSDTEALAKIELLKGLTHFDRRNPIKIALILPFDTQITSISTAELLWQ